MDASMITAVNITPNTVNAGEQVTITVTALFLRPVGTILFDKGLYDHGVWAPEP